MQTKNCCLLLLSFFLICLSPGVASGGTGGRLIPLDFDSISNNAQFSIVRCNISSLSVDLEVLLKEEPYVPLYALTSYCGYSVIPAAKTWRIKTNGKTNHLFLEDNILEMEEIKITIKGQWAPLRNEYYLSLSDFQLLTGATALWNPSLMEIIVHNLPKAHRENSEMKNNESMNDNSRPFQPVNRLTYFNNTVYSSYHPPTYDELTTDLSWETGGSIWGGQLTIGGLTDYNFDSHNHSIKVNQFLWENDTELGKWSLGTLNLPFGTFYPDNWRVNGLAFSTPGWHPLYAEEKPTIKGQAPIGSTVELWVDGLLYQRELVNDGEYEFELWLVARRSHKMRLMVKTDQTLLEEKEWVFLPRADYLAPKTTYFLTSIGFQEKNKYNSHKNLFTSVSEWLIGFEDATLGLNMAAIDETDTSDKILQFSETLSWQIRSNLTLKTKAWYVTPDLGKAGRISLSLGLPKTTFLTSYYHQTESFSPVFTDCKDGRREQFELGTYWKPWKNYLLQIRGSVNKRKYQDPVALYSATHKFTEEWAYYREVGLSAPLLSGHIMGVLGRSDQTVNDLETVNERTEFSWSTGIVSDCMFELGWTGEKETSEDLKNNNECMHFEKYWLDIGFGFNSERRYSLYLFSEHTRDIYTRDIADDNETGLNLTLWKKNIDNSFWSLGMGISERAKDSFSWRKWSLNTSFYKEILPETFLKISGNYYYEPDSPLGDGESYQISIAVNGGLSFTPQGILPGKDTDTINDGQVSGRVFLDSNSNGILDKGEKGIPGIEVAIDNIALSVTDSQGRFIFHRIPPGIHHLKHNIFTLPIKYRPVTDDIMITVTAGSTQSVNLGLEIVGSISGRVYIDMNKNGTFDPTDQPLPGVKVITSDEKHSVITGQKGDYYVLMTPGTYHLRVDESSLPRGLKVKEKTITITASAEEIKDLDFPLLKE